MLDVQAIRKDFPILDHKIYDKPLIYFDNGATTQKPRQVVEKIENGYYNVNANIHRGVHFLSQAATEAHEEARKTVQHFLNARFSNEIIFTRGTTESINLIASSFTDECMSAGDEVIVSVMEHHSNIVPWQIQAARKGITLKVIPMNEKGELNLDEYRKLFSDKTRLVSVTHVSNVLGTVNPVKAMIEIAHEQDVPVLIDGAQAVPHMKVDVQDLDAEFYVFSGHKIYGPTGIGVLYGKEEWLDKLPPYQGGGEMIATVSFEKTTFNELPFKFEAGTPDYIGDIDVGDVGPRAEQLLVAHDQLRVDLVARLEEQVAADDPVARQHVYLVARTFEPVAVGVEGMLTLDGDVAHGFSRIGFQQAAFVQYAAAECGVQHGLYEKHSVEHARHGAAVGLGLDAVVQPLIAFGSGGVQAVGLESVGRVYVGRSYFGTAHAGTGRSGETNAHCREDGQYEYADPAGCSPRHGHPAPPPKFPTAPGASRGSELSHPARGFPASGNSTRPRDREIFCAELRRAAYGFSPHE